MEQQALWMVAVIGAGTLVGVFYKMKGGFGPLNLRVTGLVLIAVLAALLAIAKSDNLNAAMGILGAIAGYLFGARTEDGGSHNESEIAISDTVLGDNARVAGRDINETVNNINARVQELGRLLSQEGMKVDRMIASQDLQRGPTEYLLNTIYDRQLALAGGSIGVVIGRWASEGWRFLSLSSDYQGMDGIFLLFERPSKDGEPHVYVYHGVNMNPV